MSKHDWKSLVSRLSYYDTAVYRPARRLRKNQTYPIGPSETRHGTRPFWLQISIFRRRFRPLLIPGRTDEQIEVDKDKPTDCPNVIISPMKSVKNPINFLSIYSLAEFSLPQPTYTNDFWCLLIIILPVFLCTLYLVQLILLMSVSRT